MDDFGTGYSSLSTLQAFPFDKIKVDKSFIQAVETSVHAARDRQRRRCCSAAVSTSRAGRGRRDHTRHLDFLREEGCNSVQGYLFGRPMPVEIVNRMIDDAKAARPDEAEARRAPMPVEAA